MAVVNTTELVKYLNDLLRIADFPDSPNALNGLQVDNSGTVSRVAAAVDASEQTIRECARRGCDFLIVHHGLFWDGNLPATGPRYRKLSTLMSSNTALYGAHIPLDVHPELGNNAILASLIGVAVKGTFGEYKGVDLGVWGELKLTREALAARLDEALGVRIRMIPGGSEIVRRVAIVSGAAAGMMAEAEMHRMDALITGEGNHHTYAEAMERRLNLYYGGHYATEVWGVRALAEHIESKFGLPWEFIDVPTGL
jgi:dinuclear metal center YbgI/SA1388 family protein